MKLFGWQQSPLPTYTDPNDLDDEFPFHLTLLSLPGLSYLPILFI
jgi:hypothetical protein